MYKDGILQDGFTISFKKGPMVGHLFGLPFSHYVNIILIQSGTSLG